MTNRASRQHAYARLAATAAALMAFLTIPVRGQENFYIGVTVNATGQVSPRDNAVTIRGVVACAHPVSVRLEGMLWQAGPGTTGYIFHDVSCTGQDAWYLSVSPFEGGRFLPGSAEISLRASAVDPETGATARDDFSGTITLRVRQRRPPPR